MIIAHIESLILEQGTDDALKRALAYVDGIMIHFRRKEPDEIFEFMKGFRALNKTVPVAVAPTAFNTVMVHVLNLILQTRHIAGVVLQ